VREVFQLNDELLLSVFKLGGYAASKAELAAWLAREGEPKFVVCEDAKLARVLNGLIIKNRGAKDEGIPEPERVLSNNMVLRKLSIALNLHADDLLKLLRPSELSLSKHELSALFRSPDNKHYRKCSDQLLSDMLDGMARLHSKTLS
jgi:uncharacterized protein YehS (DUF1456 family)